MEANTGITNPLQHVFMWHSNFLSEMANAGNNSGTLVGYIDDKSFKIYSWIDMTLSCNLPFSFCESQAATNYVKIGSLSTDSLIKYMGLLTREVEHTIADLLPNLTLLDVRDLFDALIRQVPAVARYLAPTAPIVKSCDFEDGCVDVLLGREAYLSGEQASMLEPLVVGGSKPGIAPAALAAVEKGFASMALEEARRQRENAPRYRGHVACIAPTSNVMERFFSQAKAVLGSYRQGMTPLHLEHILFLKVNRKLWNASTVRKIVRRSPQ